MRLFAKNSIGSKILVAFLAMGAIAGIIGAYGYGVLSAAGDMVVETYDGPLMSINFARAASLDFAQMQNDVLERRLVSQARQSEIDGKIEDAASTFFDDLNVARDRSSDAAELKTIAEIETSARQWEAVRKTAHSTDTELDALGAKIMDKFDTLIELNADASFIGRRKAVWSIGYFKYASIGVTAGALLLAFVITILLARKIVRPLSAAVAVADRIAEGEMQTPIPTGARDETGHLLRSMTIMQDNIRQMVERETARAQSAEVRLTEALENSGEGVILANSKGEVIIANSQISRFFPSLTQPLPGLSLQSVLRLFDAALAGHAEIASRLSLAADNGQFRSINAERQLALGRWVHFHGNPTSDGGFILLLSDFTEIKHRENNFKLAKQAAEEASAAKSRFLANMSHELRTPLNAIIGFSEIINGQMFGKIENARYVEYSADILRSGRHLLEVINSVLELSRSEAGKTSFNGTPVDLRTVLRDCASMVREQCTASNLTFAVPEFPQPLFVIGERPKLRQIFLNLLSNAVKFTERGGTVSIAIAADDAESLWVSISDTGIGMSPEDIQIALTPFGQVDNHLQRRYEGTGLGLPLTNALVELHNGVLKIESERGKGTTVSVCLKTTNEISLDEPEADEALSA